MEPENDRSSHIHFTCVSRSPSIKSTQRREETSKQDIDTRTDHYALRTLVERITAQLGELVLENNY